MDGYWGRDFNEAYVDKGSEYAVPVPERDLGSGGADMKALEIGRKVAECWFGAAGEDVVNVGATVRGLSRSKGLKIFAAMFWKRNFPDMIRFLIPNLFI